MESEDGWRRVLENSSDLVFVVDEHGTLTYISPVSERMLGYSPLARVGDSMFDLVHPEDVGRATEGFAGTIARGGIAPPLEVRVQTASGDWRELEVVANNLLDDPVVRGVILNGRDLSERRVAAENLAASESRFEYAFEHAAVGMTITDANGQFLRVNQALCTLLGFSAADFVGMSFFDLTHPDDMTRTKEGVRALLAGEAAPYVLDKRYRRADGSYTWVRVRASIMHATEHRPTQLLGYVEDIAARRALEANLEYDATHDRLTGLATRAVLYDQLERALASRRRDGTDVAVLFVDLDRFKLVNDTFGHLEGDAVLREVAERIKATVRPSDLPARLGGDEFVVCAPALRDPADAVQIAERLVEALQVPVASDGQTIVIGASVGIAFARDDSDPDQLLRDSDHAVYRAKERGRGRVEVFDRRLQRRIDLRRQSERAIDRHLSDGTLQFALWPIVSLEPRTVIGFDCRIDWDAIGLAGADIDGLYESPARAARLDIAVIRSMLALLTEWQATFPPGTAPGLGTMLESLEAAGADHRVANLIAALTEIRQASPADPGSCWVGVPEAAFTRNPERAARTVGALARLGFGAALRGFGSRVSSLEHLRMIAPGNVVLDGALTRLVDADPETRAVVDAVLKLAKAFGLTVIVAGVENEAQASEILAMGCELALGPLFGAPITPAQVPEFLASSRG